MVHIAFRVDANSQIGTGHFMRCLTLAAALKRRGAQIQFVSRGLPSYLHSMLVAREIGLVSLNAEETEDQSDDLAHSHWLPASQAQDAQATIRALSGISWDWLIVDHYALDARWQGMLRNSANQIMVIDDLADRRHDCDVLLDQNLFGDMQARYAARVPARCRLLLGPQFSLLRDEFRPLRKQIKPRTGSVRKILVFFGGVDAGNCTGTALKALANISSNGFHVDVVIGAQHPCREEIEQSCAAQGYSCHVQTDRMAKLIAAADLGIGAGGSASWERCCLGLPAVLVSLADNQVDIAKALEEAGACVYIGPSATIDATNMERELTKLLSAPESLRSMSKRALLLTDGTGVDKVCQELGC